MLDQFLIFTTTGVVIYSKTFFEIVGNPVNKLIHDVLLGEHNDSKEFIYDSYALKWNLANDLGLVFVAVYQKILQLTYIDELLEKVKQTFINLYRDELPVVEPKEFDFDSTFCSILDTLENANKKSKPTINASKPMPIVNSDSDSSSERNVEKVEEEGKEEEEEEDSLFMNPLIGKVTIKKGSSKKMNSNKDTKKKETVKSSKFTLKGEEKVDVNSLDRSKPREEKQEDIIHNFNDSEVDKEVNIEPVASSWGSSLFGGFFKRFTGDYALQESDIDPVLDTLKKKLIDKNVAIDIASQITESVKQKLLGQKVEGFTRISTIVSDALEDSVHRILTPKSNFDLLREIYKKKEQGKVYSIVFCGVNGVGKSTSLSKVAYYLKSKGLKLMIAACDTFRSGAVEQLRTHVNRLDIELFERGYAKDPADVCNMALKYAQSNGIDVVLIDTAGRMQNNERLMRSLVKLVNQNSPDFVVFVGEALVGNDGVDQLVEFNKALQNLSDIDNPRLIDGIILTKFDTIDDKVGAALSMVYTTNCPIIFVGTGQKYTNLKKINVKEVVNSLLI
ncbi:hypothetical protein WA158_002347 [Blastocystis sp. Blastoise]